MLQINNEPQFTSKFINKFLENGFDFWNEKELKIYILYLLFEGGSKFTGKSFQCNNGKYGMR